MLAPVPEKRKDGKSSFSSLYQYLTTSVNEKTGEVSERGEIMISPALISTETSALEMKSLAEMNPHCKDAVLHFILSWQEGETPSKAAWQEAVNDTMAELKDRNGQSLKEHQYLAVAHTDTENFHVHVMANRVHPETYRANAPAWLHRSLDKVCRELENRHRWKENHGLYQWDKVQKKAVRTPKHLLEQWRQEQEKEGRTATGKAAKMTHYHDSETLEAYCKAEPSRWLNRLFKENKDSLNWQRIHSELGRFGLVLHQAEKGGFTVSDHNGKHHVKASKVFRNLFSGKTAQVWRDQNLGEFMPPSADITALSHSPSSCYEKRPSKRDPITRQVRKEERRQSRQELFSRYAEAKKSFEKQALPIFEEKKSLRIAEMKESAAILKDAKKQIRASGQSKNDKLLEIGIAIFEHQERCDVIKKQIREDKKASRLSSREEWITGEATKGDEAAVAWLRGQHYVEQRKKKKEAQDTEKNTVTFSSPIKGQFDPAIQPFDQLDWFVNRQNGFVEYRQGNQIMFTDSGPEIELSAEATDTAILAALRLARGKYGQQIKVDGNPELNERIATVAKVNQLDIRFTDLKMQALMDAKQEEAPIIPEQTGSVPVSVGVSHDEAYQSLVQRLKGEGKVVATVKENGRTRGRVTEITADGLFVVLHLGRDLYAIHSRLRLPDGIVMGQRLDIMYRERKGHFMEKMQERGGRER